MRASTEHVTHPDQAFRLLSLTLDAFDGGLHRHPQFELTWIQEGVGLRFVGDSVEPFDGGDLVAKLLMAVLLLAPYRALVRRFLPNAFTFSASSRPAASA